MSFSQMPLKETLPSVYPSLLLQPCDLVRLQRPLLGDVSPLALEVRGGQDTLFPGQGVPSADCLTPSRGRQKHTKLQSCSHLTKKKGISLAA